MTLKWNPFAMATHNTVRWPRIAHHAMHVLLGLPVALLARWTGLTLDTVVVGALALAIVDKCIWIDTGRRRLVWAGWIGVEPFDFAADLGFTLLGATLPAWWVALPVYYVLQLVSDP